MGFLVVFLMSIAKYVGGCSKAALPLRQQRILAMRQL